MTDPRTLAITAIRTRLSDTAGVWPVAYKGIPFTPNNVPYLQEDFPFGNEADAEVPQIGAMRLREARESYQLMLYVPIGQDVRVATEQAGLIARSFLDNSNPVMAGSYPLWFSDYRLSDRGADSGWQRFVLVLTYTHIYSA